MDIVKQIFTVKSLSLGWSITWRAFLAALVNAIAVMIVMWLVGFLGDAITNIVGVIAGIYYIIFNFLAVGWAVQRIKDKL